jgi:hyperosmotically inducible periplasmic protein
MKPTILGRFLITGLLLAAGVAGAATRNTASGPQSDEQIARNVRHEVLMYPNYSIWDDVNFRVNNGSVELLGAVNQPFKKSDLQHIVQRVPGVTSVTNELKVLPLSNFDDRLRLQVARSIYGYPALTRYAFGAVPPIHIIVDNGRVTLTGVVANDMDKQIAGMRASAAGLSFGAIENNLQVEHPTSKK